MSPTFLGNFVNIFFSALYLLIFIRVILSWVPGLQESRIGEFVIEVTDPVLKPIQKIIPPLGGLDLSPIVAFFLLQFLQGFISGYI